MADFVFDKPVVTVGFETSEKVRVSQSATFSGTYSQVGIDQLLEDGLELSAGLNTVGARYRITAQSLLDFTTIGAVDNNVGTEFVATGQLTLTAADKLLELGLSDNPSDATQYVVSVPAAIDTKYTKLQFVTSAGTLGDSAIVEAKVSAPGSFQVVVYGIDAGLQNIEGIELDAAPVGGSATANQSTVINTFRTTTDAAGRASIDNMPADAGEFYINFGNQRKIIDTTGRESTIVNWKDI